MPIEFHYEMQEPKQEKLTIPYDTRPMEGMLRPQEKIALHGGIVIVNYYEHAVLIQEEFKLHAGGYHVHVLDPETGGLLISFRSSMNKAYLFFYDGEKFAVEQLDVEEPGQEMMIDE